MTFCAHATSPTSVYSPALVCFWKESRMAASTRCLLTISGSLAASAYLWKYRRSLFLRTVRAGRLSAEEPVLGRKVLIVVAGLSGCYCYCYCYWQESKSVGCWGWIDRLPDQLPPEGTMWWLDRPESDGTIRLPERALWSWVAFWRQVGWHGISGDCSGSGWSKS